MNIFSFRAECFHDVQLFLDATTKNGTTTATIVKPDNNGFADHEIEFQSMLPLEELREVMRSIADGHVMVQTLRQCPLSENSLERDKTV